MFKKSLSFTLATVFLLCNVFLFPNTYILDAEGAIPPVSFNLVGPTGGETLDSDSFEISVCISVPEGLPGGGIGGVAVELSYTTLFFKTSAENITMGDGLPDASNSIAFISDGIKFIYDDMNTVLTAGEYTLFTVEFTIADITREGEYNFKLETLELFDNSLEMNDIPFNNDDLDIYVGDRADVETPSVTFSLEGPEDNDSHGEKTVEITVNANIPQELADVCVGGMKLILSYNSSCFGALVKDISLGEQIGAEKSNFTVAQDGITFFYDDVNSGLTAGEHTLFTVKFTIADNTPEGKYGFSINTLELFDNSDDMNDILSVNNNLKIYVGEEFQVTAESDTLYVGDSSQLYANKPVDYAENSTGDIISFDGSSVTALKPGKGKMIFYSITGQIASVNFNVYQESAQLSSLTIANGVLSPSFSPNVYQYSITIPQSDSCADIRAIAADPNAVININNSTVAAGEMKSILITVTSGKGTMQQTYTISVTRQPSQEISTAFEAYSEIYGMNNSDVTSDNLSEIEEAIGIYNSLTNIQKTKYLNEYTALTANRDVATLDKNIKAITASPAAYATVSEYAGVYAAADYTNSSISDAITAKKAELMKFFPNVLGGTIKISANPDKQDLKFNVSAPSSITYDGMYIKEYGVVFLPTDILGDNELIIGTPNSVTAKGILGEGEDIPTIFNANLGSSAASDARCARDISARAYVIWTDGTNDYTLYSINSQNNIVNGTAVRSVYGIARTIAAAINGSTIYGEVFYSESTVPEATTDLSEISNINILKFVSQNIAAIRVFVAN